MMNNETSIRSKTKSVDNYDKIRKILNFEDESLFYYIEIILRKKDVPTAKSSKVLYTYYFSTLEKYNSIESEVKQLCDTYGARAMIRLNRRSYEQVAMKLFEYAGKYAQYKDFKAFRGLYSKAAGNCNAENKRIWIVDVDGTDVIEPLKIYRAIEALHLDIKEDYRIIVSLSSKSGFHIVTNPFNVKKFKETGGMENIDIHKDNPTNLYIP